MEKLVPRNQGEAVAVFRSQVVGTLLHRKPPVQPRVSATEEHGTVAA